LAGVTRLAAGSRTLHNFRYIRACITCGKFLPFSKNFPDTVTWLSGGTRKAVFKVKFWLLFWDRQRES